MSSFFNHKIESTSSHIEYDVDSFLLLTGDVKLLILFIIIIDYSHPQSISNKYKNI
ncbi:MAG: hypothetical protein Q8M44_05545 [bacterium]|nr:hypothetical protein [bacterium]